MSLDETTKFITTVGFPIAILLLFLFGGWRVLKWLGLAFTEHVVPLINDHRDLMGELRNYLKEQKEKPDNAALRSELTELRLQMGQLQCVKKPGGI